jgi:exonuclease VII large subunit
VHQVLQDLQQIRSICQQLAQNERQNVQQLSVQPGLQSMAQRESFAAQQLQRCVSLCQRIEQQLTQQQWQLQQQMHAAQPQYQASPSPGFAAGASPVAASSFRSGTTSSAYTPSFTGMAGNGAYAQRPQAPFTGNTAAAGQPSVNLAGLRAVMQADKSESTRSAPYRPPSH